MYMALLLKICLILVHAHISRRSVFRRWEVTDVLLSISLVYNVATDAR